MTPNCFLPSQYRSSWCIAGGYAACPALARDIDVWVYGIETNNLERAQATILSYVEGIVAALNQKRPIWPEKRYCFEQEVESREFTAYEHALCRIEKVCVVKHPRSHPVRVQPMHIMVTDAPDPGTLLQGFDVSTHAVAIDHDMRIWKHRWTHPGERPIALLSNEKTPERMKRICERFGHSYTETAIDKTD